MAADRVAASPDGADDLDVATAVTSYQTQAAAARAALTGATGTPARSLVADVQEESARLQSAVDDATALHREANASAGLVADIETLFMMVFAAVMAGLLFRRFEAARRSGELGVAAATARGEARFQALVHNSSDLITLIDSDLAITYQTPSVTRLLGYARTS